MEIVLDLLNNKKIVSILVEKRIEEIVGSYNLIKGNKAEVERWFATQYPKQVI